MSAIFFALWKKWYDFLQKKIRGDSGKVPWRHWKSIFDSSLCIVFGTVVYFCFWWKTFTNTPFFNHIFFPTEHNTQPFPYDAKEGFQRVQIERELLWKVLGLVSGEICAVRLFKFVILNIQIKTFQISSTTR